MMEGVVGCSCKLPVKILKIGGIEVGFTGLNVAFEKVKELNISDHEKIKHELLLRTKYFGNYVPKEKEDSYKLVLFDEYNKYLTNK
jgi:hypothetical protein